MRPSACLLWYQSERAQWKECEAELRRELAKAEAVSNTSRNQFEGLELQLRAKMAEQDAAKQAVKRQQGEWADREAGLQSRNKELFTQIEELQAKLTTEVRDGHRRWQCLHARSHVHCSAALRMLCQFNARQAAVEEASSLANELRASKAAAEAAATAAAEAATRQQAEAAARLDAATKQASNAEAAAATLQARVAELEASLSARDQALQAATQAKDAAEARIVTAVNEAQATATKFQASSQLRSRMASYCCEVKSATSSVRRGLRSLANDVRDSMATTAEDFGRLGTSLVSAVAAAQEQRDRAITNYQRETAERRRVFNLLQEARGNIRVFCRVRPLLGKEIGTESTVVTTNPNNYSELAVECDGGRGGVPTLKKFEFDHVFGPETSQEQVFEEVSPFVTSALDG